MYMQSPQRSEGFAYTTKRAGAFKIKTIFICEDENSLQAAQFCSVRFLL